MARAGKGLVVPKGGFTAGLLFGLMLWAICVGMAVQAGLLRVSVGEKAQLAPATPVPSAFNALSVLKVRDGDTVVVKYFDYELPLRLKYVDTQESVHPDAARNTALGASTSAWAKEYLADQRVRVEFEHNKHGMISTDRYGRALGLLFLDRDPAGPGPEDELYNLTLVEQGFSPYVTQYGTAGERAEAFAAAESAAKRAKRGIWAMTAP